MEIKMNKEIRDYTEKMFFGLTARQFFFSAIALGIAVLLYFVLKPYVSLETISWACIISACPFGILGFVNYNGLPAEKFLYIMFRFYFLEPHKLCCKPINYYYESWKMSQKNKKGSKVNKELNLEDEAEEKIDLDKNLVDEAKVDMIPSNAQPGDSPKISPKEASGTKKKIKTRKKIRKGGKNNGIKNSK